MSLIYSIDMLRYLQLHICVKIENRTVKFAWQVTIGNTRSSCQKKKWFSTNDRFNIFYGVVFCWAENLDNSTLCSEIVQSN